jgi:hypothetical protein
MGGYRAEDTAGLVETAVSRYTRRAEGSVTSSGTLLDLERGWARISRRARAILSQYARAELPPPAIDLDAAREAVRKAQELGVAHHRESREIRETMAVHSLSGNMSNREKKPVLVYAGPARRGLCRVCEARIERGKAWYLSGLVWCEDHGPTPDVALS